MATGFGELFAPALHRPPPGRPQGQLFSQAYTQISRRIATLELAPGDTFAESALATRLQLSKTPVREALIVLRELGLVEAQAGSGYTVRPVDDIPGLWRCDAMIRREVVGRLGTAPPAPPGTGLVGPPELMIAVFDAVLADFTEANVGAYVGTVLVGQMLFLAAAGDTYLMRMAMQLQANLERSLRLALQAAARHGGPLPPRIQDGGLVAAAMSGDLETARRLHSERPDLGAWVVDVLGLTDTT